MKILVSGFGSFLDNHQNPSAEVLKLLPKRLDNHQIITVELPVVYNQCFVVLRPLIAEYQPDIIINLGLAADRKKISLERVAINLNDSLSKDNQGQLICDQLIIPTGENAYFSTLPLRKIMTNMTTKKLPSEISLSAGTYVCNNLMYHVLHYLEENNLTTKAGFVHLPLIWEESQVENKKGLPLDVILEGVIEIIKASI